MENTKVISIIGYERSDIPFFLSLLLKEKKLKVLAIDNSFSHDMFHSLKKADETTDYLEFDRVIYMQNRTINIGETGPFEKFDAVILYHGMNVDYDLLSISDTVVFATNYEPYIIQSIKDTFDMPGINEIPKEKLFVVFRDKVGTKVSEQYLLKQFGLNQIEEEFVIYYDEGNYEAYLNFCYNGTNSNLKGTSSELKGLLNSIRATIIGSARKKKKAKNKETEEVKK